MDQTINGTNNYLLSIEVLEIYTFSEISVKVQYHSFTKYIEKCCLQNTIFSSLNPWRAGPS